jgi:hypothetical protein
MTCAADQQASCSLLKPSKRLLMVGCLLRCGVLQVVGVLRHKYLFKTRAKALISKPQR